MALPLAYSIRNMFRRSSTTLLTILGVAVVVFACVLMLGVSNGIYSRLAVTGEEENMLLISRKGQNVMFSSIEEEEIVELYSFPGLAEDSFGDALVSPEIMHVSFVDHNYNGKLYRAPVSVRGVGNKAYDVHRSVRIAEGQLPSEQYEVIVGSSVYAKLGLPKGAMKVGATINFEGRDWTVTGVFDNSGSLFESEIWVQLDDLKTVMKRRTVSFAVVRFESPAALIEGTQMFSATGPIERYFKGWMERDYYAEFSKALSWVYWLSLLMVAAVTLSGVLIGANTMYTAVVSRLVEISTLRVLGFRRLGILASLLFESILIALLGGICGVAAGYALHGLPLKFSQGAFYITVDAPTAAIGMGLAIFIGLVGAFFPALKGVRVPVVDGLRSK